MADESKEWMGVCYDDNVIEYDEFDDQQDDVKVEIDVVEVDAENLVEFTIDQTQYDNIETAAIHGYQLDEEVSNFPESQLNSVIQVDHEVEEVVISHRNTEHLSEQTQQQPPDRNLRHLRLKCFIQRENNRLKKKSLNCRLCGTHARFLDMQIRVLKAEKQKLLEETSILRLNKEKLSKQITSTETYLLAE